MTPSRHLRSVVLLGAVSSALSFSSMRLNCLRCFSWKKPVSARMSSTNLHDLLPSHDLQGVGSLLSTLPSESVIVMVGAGISVSAGIPDFRTPGTGLYSNLQSYDLPAPEAIFDLSFFRQKPGAFYRLCAELWPGQYTPTAAHRFIRLLNDKGLLLRCFSQNIDSLETAAGLPKERLVAAHGNFDSAHCLDTGREVPIEEVKQAAMTEGTAGWDDLNARHGGLVKPDIVFFGESLPPRFFELAQQDFPKCELLIVMGTSLEVHPFASLIKLPRPGTPRLLINRERVGESYWGGGFVFHSLGTAPQRDVFFQGDADDGVEQLAKQLGWDEELAA